MSAAQKLKKLQGSKRKTEAFKLKFVYAMRGVHYHPSFLLRQGINLRDPLKMCENNNLNKAHSEIKGTRVVSTSHVTSKSICEPQS